MVLLKGERAQAALEASNQAIERAETIAARLNNSLALLRSRRDELAEKMIADAAAVTHRREPQIIVPAPAPVWRWSF